MLMSNLYCVISQSSCPLLPSNLFLSSLFIILFFHILFERDRLSRNDVIGTTYLNLTKIASSGGEIEGTVRFFICVF